MHMQTSIYDNDFKNIENSHNAYMLVYEKKTKVPFKIDICKDDIAKIRENSCALSELPNCYRLYPGLYEQVRTETDMKFDAKKDEHYALVDQTVFNPVIPVEQRVGILFDNQKFLVEKQVFSPAFYATTTHLFERVIDDIGEREDAAGAMFKILDHLVFELIANSRQPQGLDKLTELILRVAFSNKDTMTKMIEERIFVPEEKLEKDEKNFFEVLVHHEEPQVRQMASDMLQHVFARCFD